MTSAMCCEVQWNVVGSSAMITETNIFLLTDQALVIVMVFIHLTPVG